MSTALRLNLQRISAIIPAVGFFLILRDNPYILEASGFAAALVLSYIFSFNILPKLIKQN